MKMSDFNHKDILSFAQLRTVQDCMDNFEFTTEQRQEVIDRVEKRWLACSGRFYVYAEACVICADVEREASDEDSVLRY